MENKAAHSAISAASVWPPKSTMLLIVEATELLILVITNTPRKLNTALIMIAVLTFRHRVAMQVAMAFGASVQPFTNITPSVSATVTRRTGFENTCWQNPAKETSIYFSFFFVKYARFHPDTEFCAKKPACFRQVVLHRIYLNITFTRRSVNESLFS